MSVLVQADCVVLIVEDDLDDTPPKAKRPRLASMMPDRPDKAKHPKMESGTPEVPARSWNRRVPMVPALRHRIYHLSPSK